MLSKTARKHFDSAFERAMKRLPKAVRALLNEVPVIVEDLPSRAVAAEMGCLPEELCGLHWGTPLCDRGVVEPVPQGPDRIMIFRIPIIELADESGDGPRSSRLENQITITLLHEIGHHFGLSEERLAELGYE